MDEKINKIFARHFMKLKGKLEEIHTAQIILDAISKEFTFCLDDVKNAIKGDSNDNFNR